MDVFIHEIIVRPEIWAMKTHGLPEPRPCGNPDTAWRDHALHGHALAPSSSRAPQGAFGC